MTNKIHTLIKEWPRKYLSFYQHKCYD